MFFSANNFLIGQYRNISVIFGTFSYVIWYSIICNRSSFIAMYFLPIKREMGFRDNREGNNVPEITDLLRYLLMLEILNCYFK